MIELAHIADFMVTVADPIEIGRTAAGIRRLIPITGGEATGPKLRGRILDAGAYFQVERADGVIELHARYALETSDGALIYIENSGIRRGDPVYCRTTPRFETADESYLWLTRSLFLAEVVRRPHLVEVAIYQVL